MSVWQSCNYIIVPFLAYQDERRWVQSKEEAYPTVRHIDGILWCGFEMKEVVVYTDDEGNEQVPRCREVRW